MTKRMDGSRQKGGAPRAPDVDNMSRGEVVYSVTPEVASKQLEAAPGPNAPTENSFIAEPRAQAGVDGTVAI